MAGFQLYEGVSYSMGCIEMKVNSDGKFAIPTWTWILSAVSFLAIVGGIWWASYASALERSSTIQPAG